MCWKRFSDDFHIEVEDLHAEPGLKKNNIYIPFCWVKFSSLLGMSLLRIDRLIWLMRLSVSASMVFFAVFFNGSKRRRKNVVSDCHDSMNRIAFNFRLWMGVEQQLGGFVLPPLQWSAPSYDTSKGIFKNVVLHKQDNLKKCICWEFTHTNLCICVPFSVCLAHSWTRPFLIWEWQFMFNIRPFLRCLLQHHGPWHAQPLHCSWWLWGISILAKINKISEVTSSHWVKSRDF